MFKDVFFYLPKIYCFKEKSVIMKSSYVIHRKSNVSPCINGQCTTRDSQYKKHKREQLPWKFNSLF